MRRLLAVALVLATMGTEATSSPAAEKTYVPRGIPDDAPTYKPHAFVAGSGVGGGVMDFTGVTWDTWRRMSATGKGTLEYNTCEPGGCASGNLRKVAATIRLHVPKRGCELWRKSGNTVKTNRLVFTNIDVKFEGETWRSITSGTAGCQADAMAAKARRATVRRTCRDVVVRLADGTVYTRTQGLFATRTRCATARRVARAYLRGAEGTEQAPRPLGFVCRSRAGGEICRNGRRRVSWRYAASSAAAEAPGLRRARLSAAGLGRLRFGMTPAQASRALHVRVEVASHTYACGFWSTPGLRPGAVQLVSFGTAERLTVAWAGPGLRTTRGVTIGDSAEKLHRRYPRGLHQGTAEDLGGSDDHLFFDRREGGRTYTLMFSMYRDRVSGISAGLKRVVSTLGECA